MVLHGKSLDEQLIDAVKERNIEEVKSLLDKGANPDAERLSVLDKEANPFARNSLSSKHSINLVFGMYLLPQYSIKSHDNSISALGYAINLAYTEIAKLLINRGASIDGYSHSSSPTTHLSNAAELGRTEIVELLLSRGADVNVQDISGYTALHSAVRSFQYLSDGTETIKITNLLLDHGADINARDDNGCTALHIAATYKRVGVTELLLDRGADVSVRGGYDMTALRYAASSIYNNAETIKLLLKYNLDINAQDFKGQTPISLGLKKQILPSDSTLNADVLFTFLVHGATLNEDDRSKINRNPNLQNCLTALEKIKAMPYFGKLIESNKNKDTGYIFQYIDDENEGQKLAKEFHNIKKDYGFQVELSFIPECLLSFLECVISRHNDSTIRNLRYFIGAIKTGEHTTLLPYLVSDQIFLYLRDKDLNNLNLAYHSDITGNEYDDLKTEAYIEFKREAYKEFKQDEKAANTLLDKLKGVSKKHDSLLKIDCVQKTNSIKDISLPKTNYIRSSSTSKQPQKISLIKKAVCVAIPFIAVGIYALVVDAAVFNPVVAAGIFVGAVVTAAILFGAVKIYEKKAENSDMEVGTAIQETFSTLCSSRKVAV